jgi:hypothetical protein
MKELMKGPNKSSLRSRRYLGGRARVVEKLGGECEGERKNGRGEKEIAPAGKPYVFSYFASVSGREILIG